MKNFIECFVFTFCFISIECAFRCDYKYNLMAKGWFKLYEVPETWYDARQRCSLQGAILASPTTPDIEFAMKQTMRNFFIQDTEIFTGIHATLSPGNYRTVDGIRLSEIPIVWANNEPDNFLDKERCITLNMNGAAYDRSCRETRPYICYRSGKKEVLTNKCGTVDDEYVYENKTNSCYKFHKIPKTYSRADFTCTAEGGHLLIINSETEAQVIRELYARYPKNVIPGNFGKDTAFIGFRAVDEWGDWRTVHGETLHEAGYDLFSSGEPNNLTAGQYCGGIYRNALLDDMWCETQSVFICEKDPEYPPVCQPSKDEEVRIDKRDSKAQNYRNK
ncbi:C-type mannose receptor 2-like isoform X1 [Helicoverpa zea]|uniref:C-type mannose receptor 2-like isoform X1 n=1 Tax=Helicoverpa zea TaxID=7113 RepID=UPI001F5976F6|nr:C-type mannose receptor 2-like isoform X1 [Helicoverpa zea]